VESDSEDENGTDTLASQTQNPADEEWKEEGDGDSDIALQVKTLFKKNV